MKIDTGRFTFGVLTMSDKGSRGEREDTSGPYLLKTLNDLGYQQKAYAVIPDKAKGITETLISWVDEQKVDLILTTGGTGVAPTDVTPEAMADVIEKEIPGMAEAMRAESLKKTPHAVLSRGIAGIRGNSLIINLPGSEKAARENIAVLLPSLAHALDKIKGGTSDCGVG
ncbi:molybdopterin adenylyltransferase [Desulfocapsa sulfexigens DSM 10523]|uniref:Molybdenum cofactor biosynthesis protein B n=1 Tax=Desulfocapsa sulfexigens (strain DSM 10523 / SB164P1) TaxID=1167006 RepID=M1P857_DESSD|nr:MogA/MoaB family molybdenum cofactor biosynthesis protein [Desulfocapsa sulfexigens]AGF79663.1 molybdopterin adenylyltransferase [Desulfocapsa sulfexigens DSM 10523]